MAETGLNQNWNRDYDSIVGRYVESDLIGLRGGSYSTYAYVGSDPVDWIDPLGLANLNYFNQTTDPNLYQLAQQWNPTDVYSIAGHGLVDQSLDSLNQIVLPNGQTLTAQRLARVTRQDPKWNGKPIEIRGCALGQGDNSFAQQLANLLKTKVTAGTRQEMWTSFRVPFTSILLDLGISFPLGGQTQVFISEIGLERMPVRKNRLLMYSCVAALLVALLLPGFCECPTCVVVGAKAEPCDCTILGIYLGKKAARFVAGKTTGSRDTQGARKAACESH